MSKSVIARRRRAHRLLWIYALGPTFRNPLILRKHAQWSPLLKYSTTDFVNISYFFCDIFHRPNPVTPL
jgi:hypothetical protein